MESLKIQIEFEPLLQVQKFNTMLDAIKQSLGALGAGIKPINSDALSKTLGEIQTRAANVRQSFEAINQTPIRIADDASMVGFSSKVSDVRAQIEDTAESASRLDSALAQSIVPADQLGASFDRTAQAAQRLALPPNLDEPAKKAEGAIEGMKEKVVESSAAFGEQEKKVEAGANAMKAALASVAAGGQGKFGEVLSTQISSARAQTDLLAQAVNLVPAALQRTAAEATAAAGAERQAAQAAEQVAASTSHAAGASQQFHHQIEKLKEGFHEVGTVAAGVFGGEALLGGVKGLIGGLDGIFEGGKHALEVTENLELAFAQANKPAADLEESVESVKKVAVDMADKFAFPINRIRQFSTEAASIGGATGKANEDLTKLAVAVEKSSGGLVSGEAAIRAFSKGMANPESSAVLGQLTNRLPALGAAMRGLKDPADLTNAALKFFTPTFAKLEEQAKGPIGSMERFHNSLEHVQEGIGSVAITSLTPILEAIGEKLVPLLDAGAHKVEEFAHTFHFVGDVAVALVKSIEDLVPFVAAGAVGWAAYTIAVKLKTLAEVESIGVTKLLWNTLSANPLGLLIAGITAAVVAYNYFSDAGVRSAKAQVAAAEAQKKVVEEELKHNESQQKSVKSTKQLADEYTKLASKAKLTSEESNRLKTIHEQLHEKYPELIDVTKSYKENLHGVAEVSREATSELHKLGEENAKILGTMSEANKQLAISERRREFETLRKEARSTSQTLVDLVDNLNKVILDPKHVEQGLNEARDAIQKTLNDFAKRKIGGIDDTNFPEITAQLQKVVEADLKVLKNEFEEAHHQADETGKNIAAILLEKFQKLRDAFDTLGEVERNAQFGKLDNELKKLILIPGKLTDAEKTQLEALRKEINDKLKVDLEKLAREREALAKQIDDFIAGSNKRITDIEGQEGKKRLQNLIDAAVAQREIVNNNEKLLAADRVKFLLDLDREIEKQRSKLAIQESKDRVQQQIEEERKKFADILAAAGLNVAQIRKLNETLKSPNLAPDDLASFVSKTKIETSKQAAVVAAYFRDVAAITSLGTLEQETIIQKSADVIVAIEKKGQKERAIAAERERLATIKDIAERELKLRQFNADVQFQLDLEAAKGNVEKIAEAKLKREIELSDALTSFKIHNATTVAGIELATSLGEIEKKYAADLKASQGNELLKFQAFMEFADKKRDAEQKFLLESQTANTKALVDSATKLVEAISKPFLSITEEQQQQLDKTLSSLHSEEQETTKSWLRRTLSAKDYFDKVADLQHRQVEEMAKLKVPDIFTQFTSRMSEALSKSVDSTIEFAKKSGDEAEKHKKVIETIDSDIAQNRFQSIGKSGFELEQLDNQYSDLLEKRIKTEERANKKIGDTYNLMGLAIESSMLGAAFQADASFQKIARAGLDALEKMVPIWTAQIVGGSLATPQSILTFGAEGIAEFVALTAILEGFVAAAKAAVGRVEGEALVSVQGGKTFDNRVATESSDNILRLLSINEGIINAPANLARSAMGTPNFMVIDWANKNHKSFIEFPGYSREVEKLREHHLNVLLNINAYNTAAARDTVVNLIERNSEKVLAMNEFSLERERYYKELFEETDRQNSVYAATPTSTSSNRRLESLLEESIRILRRMENKLEKLDVIEQKLDTLSDKIDAVNQQPAQLHVHEPSELFHEKVKEMAIAKALR